MGIVFKEFWAETTVKEEDGETLIHAIVSTAARDRDEEVIEPSAFKERLGSFREHPILLASHNYRDLRAQIGEARNIEVTERGLEMDFKYHEGEGNEQADWGFNIASKGAAAYSVGFIPHQFVFGGTDEEPEVTYTDVELLEVSHVTVPSNREALQAMARGKGVQAELARSVLNGMGPPVAPPAEKETSPTAIDWEAVKDALDGDDVPLDVLAKVGATVSAKNRKALVQTMELIAGVLDAAGKPEDDDSDGKEAPIEEPAVEEKTYSEWLQDAIDEALENARAGSKR